MPSSCSYQVLPLELVSQPNITGVVTAPSASTSSASEPALLLPSAYMSK